MPIVTIRVDEGLKRKMDELKEVNWSEVKQRAIEDVGVYSQMLLISSGVGHRGFPVLGGVIPFRSLGLILIPEVA